jgi:hypothetical protein
MDWLTHTNSAVGIIVGTITIGSSFMIWMKRPKQKASPKELSIADRFLLLFESHGIHRNQIPRFFGHNLTLADLQNVDSLLPKLSEKILSDVCELFAVRRVWVDGAESEPYEPHDFYKTPQEFANFLDQLLKINPEGNLSGVLIVSSDKSNNDQAIILLQECIGNIGDRSIYRYHICNNWSFSYWKSRAFLTACIAIAWKKKAYIHGIRIPQKQIGLMAEGESILGWQGGGLCKLGSKTWHPEDMALEPDFYLEGIDPEQNNFGLVSGIRLWISLAEQGFMDSSFGKAPTDKFKKKEFLLTNGN